jgi:aminoglycoside phosphotransferase (APT) family kinase protein
MDIQGLATKLEKYLDLHGTCVDHRVEDVAEISMGWETELFTFHTVSSEGENGLVLRVFSGDGAGKAVKEFSLMKRLDELGYPVPPVYFIETSGDVIGKPFIVMKRIMGTTLDSTNRSGSLAEQKMRLIQLMKLFTDLHRLDAAEFRDVENLNTVSVEWFMEFFDEVRNGYAPWLTPLLEWLGENKPSGVSSLSLCHMDFHGMNIMVNGAGQPYVIDWGSSMICDYRMDLCWTLLLYTTFGGEMYHDPMLEIYEELAGRNVDDLRFYEVLAATRRITDMVKTVGGGSSGLRDDVVELMRGQRDHYVKVHDFVEERTGVRLAELDTLLASF